MVLGFEAWQCGDRDAVMLVVIGQEGDLIGNLHDSATSQEGIVVFMHLFKVVGVQDNVG